MSSRAEPLGTRVPADPSRTAAAAWVVGALGLAVALSGVPLRHSALATAPVALTGIAATVASLVGRVRHRPETAYPWVLFAVSCGTFIVGAVLRQGLSGHALAPLADVATLSGYAAMVAGFIGLLRCRQSSLPRHELIDGAIVLVSAGAVALVVFTLPTLQAWGGLTESAVVQAVFPVIDVVLVFIALMLSWTSARRVPSFWLLGGSVVCLLVGDVGYAWIAREGRLVGSPLLDLPFALAFVLFGVAALHPSMRALSAVQPRPVPAWSRARVALLVVVAVTPTLVAVSSRTTGTRIGAGAGALVALLLLLRAVTAVRDHAEVQQVLHRQATTDPLTGLVNRPQLIELLTELLRQSDRHGGSVDVLFLDVDAFKLVNDTWGHQVGDRVLQRAAHRLLTVTENDDLVARIGGDEFVVVRHVPATGGPDGSHLAEQVVDAFRRPLPGSDHLVTTVSVGVAGTRRGTPPDAPGPDAEDLLRDSDTAMYRAKDSGKSRYAVFDPAMHDKVRQRVETELALRYALDRGELLLHYQPIVSVQTGDVVGAEALLRWAHPALGLVSPLDFIPIAEETGLIVEIGAWVLSEAVRQAAVWREQRRVVSLPPLWMSVNVSARQLQDDHFVGHVGAELLRHDLAAELLVLEITESAMIADDVLAADLLVRLRDLGLSLAVDDFGTGYSSLGHLRRFPVSKVKIDRSFVNGIEHDADDAEIVRAVVAMSLAMGLEVVAEGIETTGQHEILRSLGVHLGQGWLFGRPEPVESCSYVLPARASKTVTRTLR